MRSKKGHKDYIVSWRLILHLLCGILFFSPLKGQDTILQHRVTLNLEQVKIHQALVELSDQTKFNFTYSSDLFNDKQQISIQVKDEPLLMVLNKLITDTVIRYHVVDHQIIISSSLSSNLKSLPITPTKIMVSSKQIRGRIVDKSNKDPLPYASLGIKGKLIGSISNMEGEFELKIPPDNINDTLVISYVGYRNHSIPIQEISSTFLTIPLLQENVSLQEVIIRNTDPVALIRAAMRKSKDNYLQTPSKLTTFYREAVKKNRHYMIYLEAVLNIYKQAYNQTQRVDQPKIFKSRKIYDVSHLDTISLRLKGGVNGCLMLDVIKNRPEFLQEENLHFYRYNLDDISVYNNHPVYIIGFKPKESVPVPPLEGRLFIETRSLALIRAEFGFSPQIAGKLSNNFILKKNNKTKVKPTQVEYLVSYRQSKGKYFLNHAQGKLKFKVKHRRKFFASTFETNFEMATTQLDTLNMHRYKHREILKPNTVISRERIEYDPHFWQDQTFIQPEENIQDALRRISFSMQQIALEKKDK